MKKTYALMALFLVLSTVFVSAATSNFDQILQPVTRIYDFVKYAATAIATLFMVFAGITYMTSSSDPGKKENAKNMIAYIIIGLIIIWAAPMIVNYLVG